MSVRIKQKDDLIVIVENEDDLAILAEAYSLSIKINLGCRVLCINDIPINHLNEHFDELDGASEDHNITIDWMLASDNILDHLWHYIHTHQIQHIALSQVSVSHLRLWRSKQRQSNLGIQFHVINRSTNSHKARWSISHLIENRDSVSFSGYFWSLGIVLLVSILGQSFRPFVNPTNTVMIYLVAVVIAAIQFGRGPALFVATLSAPAFNLFFVPPLFDVDFSDLEYLPTFFGLLFAGLVISTLASRSKEQADRAKKRETETASLYSLTHELGFANDIDDLVDITSKQLSRTFKCQVDLRFYDLSIHANDEITSTDTKTHFSQILKLDRKPIGHIKLSMNDTSFVMHPRNRRLFDMLMNQVVQTYERLNLLEKSRRTELLEQKERLHLTILNSVSHDLRTPLASISGTLSSMLEYSDVYDVNTYHEMLTNAWNESKRLNRLVTNLLDMSRLKAGTMRFGLDYCDVQDLIGATLTNIESRLGERTISVEMPDEMVLVPMDFTLMERVLSNLLDNAIKYTEADTPIDITVESNEDTTRIILRDYGPGIPDNALAQIFDPFVRARPKGETDGTGLGLSICKEIVNLHQGKIQIENETDHGLRVTITLLAQQEESKS